MAANLSMLDFDTTVHAIVSAVGGSYRRYSDDILILCSAEHMAALEAVVEEALTVSTKRCPSTQITGRSTLRAARSGSHPLRPENIWETPPISGVHI